MHILGIDPGQTGALALLDEAGNPQYLWDMPCNEKGYNLKELVILFTICHRHDPTTLVVIEEQWARPGQKAHQGKNGTLIAEQPGQAAPSMGRLMQGFGQLQGIAATLFKEIDYVNIPPITWKSGLKLQGTGKKGSLRMAQRLFPGVGLRFIKQHGRAEALLLAWWQLHMIQGDLKVLVAAMRETA